MSGKSNEITRRNVLKAASGAVAVGGASGLATASPTDRVEVNVGFDAPSGRAAAVDAASEVVREFAFDALTIRAAKKAVAGLRNRPDVRYVEANGTMYALAQTLPWGVDRVDADVVHGDGETGNGADVAIIDTGIDDDHPDLQANVGKGKAFVSCRGSNCNYAWSDDNDHGTHCAGIADAIDNSRGVVGVSTEATLHAVKVLDSNGSGSFSDVAAGIEWTADQGYDVGSLSLGASSGSQTVKDACEYAYGKGVLLVAAAGNDGPCSDCVGYPAAYSECIAVSSTDSDDSLSNFSSTGPEVELAAPGGEIHSTVIGGYDTFSGTSMACPHVSGAGGQLMANGYSNTEARQQLKDTAEDVGLSSNESGSGLLDVEAALGGSSGDTNVAVSTGSATNVTDSSATLNGDLTDLGGASSADVYFEWGESGTGLGNTTSKQTLSSTGSFSADVSELSSSTDYDFRAVAEASDGDTDTGSTATFTTNSSSASSDPAIETFATTNNSNPGWARFDVDWAVSDADGDLSSVELTMTQSGSTVDSATHSVGGSSASGSDRLEDKKGSGSYDITLTVTDSAGNAVSRTETVTA